MLSTNGRPVSAVGSKSITQLKEMVEGLSDTDRELFYRLFHVAESEGALIAPETMHQWIVGLFGSVKAVEHQKIVKTTNLITLEGTLFNALRASRPMESTLPEDLPQLLASGRGDPFCRPLEGTPADVFGRVRGRHGITASNIAKYDAWHSVIVFDEHNPLHLDRQSIADYMAIGLQWARKVLEEDPAASYFFFMWNCLWKSGASILHGHAQVACTREIHYAKLEHLRRAAVYYRERWGSNYFDDLLRAHSFLGLTLSRGDTTIMASLTPIKEKEVWLVAPGVTDDLKETIFRVLECYTRRLGVTSFNLVLYMPPLRPVPEDWSDFPHIVRVVDRGALENKTADIGAMELYASSVVSSDPFRLIEALEPVISGQ